MNDFEIDHFEPPFELKLREVRVDCGGPMANMTEPGVSVRPLRFF